MIKKKELLKRIEELEQKQMLLIEDNQKFRHITIDNYDRVKSIDPYIDTYVPKLKKELDKLHQEVIAFEQEFDKHKQEPSRDFGGEIEELKKSVETLAKSIQPLLVAQVEKDLADFGKILSELFKGEPKKKSTKKKVEPKENKKTGSKK